MTQSILSSLLELALLGTLLAAAFTLTAGL